MENLKYERKIHLVRIQLIDNAKKITMNYLKMLVSVKHALIFSFSLFVFISCQKADFKSEDFFDHHGGGNSGHLKLAKTFSSDVVVKWLNMELEMMRVPLPAGVGSQAADRVLAYNGIALYQSVLPGMPSYKTLGGQLNSLPAMPGAEPGKAYHWAASANAAMAFMNRKLFPASSEANKTADG